MKKLLLALLLLPALSLRGDDAPNFWTLLNKATRDTFADNLKLPENVVLAEPEKELHCTHIFTGLHHHHWRDTDTESFQRYVLSAINHGPVLDDDAVCNIPSLAKLLSSPDTKEKLLQYFACNSEWRLYLELRGGVHAVRYFRYTNGNIAPTLNQFYACFLPTGIDGKKVGDPALEFQFRFDIALNGTTWNRRKPVTEHRGNSWQTVFHCADALISINDQSNFTGRQMTAAALEYSEKEFAQLAADLDNWKKYLPKDSFKIGEPDLILRDSFQGGIYEAAVWCNPGEKGMIYLKAFEITKGTPLSAKRLKTVSNCISGWSDDPREQYQSNMYFTIYEGEWGQFYGARFEVWFKPASGAQERKLFEKNYKIQGWQR